MTDEEIYDRLIELDEGGLCRIGDGRLWEFIKDHKAEIIRIISILIVVLGEERDRKC